MEARPTRGRFHRPRGTGEKSQWCPLAWLLFRALPGGTGTPECSAFSGRPQQLETLVTGPGTWDCVAEIPQQIPMTSGLLAPKRQAPWREGGGAQLFVLIHGRPAEMGGTRWPKVSTLVLHLKPLQHWCWSAWFSWGKSGYTASGLRAPCPPSSLCLSLSRVACPGQMEQGGGPFTCPDWRWEFLFLLLSATPFPYLPTASCPTPVSPGSCLPQLGKFSVAPIYWDRGSQVAPATRVEGVACACHSFHKTQFGGNEVFSPV